MKIDFKTTQSPRAEDTPQWPFQPGKWPSTLKFWGHLDPNCLRFSGALPQRDKACAPSIFLRWTVRSSLDCLESYFQHSPTVQERCPCPVLHLDHWISLTSFSARMHQKYLSIAWRFASFQPEPLVMFAKTLEKKINTPADSDQTTAFSFGTRIFAHAHLRMMSKNWVSFNLPLNCYKPWK